MKSIHSVCIALIICSCLALPAAAQKSIRPLPRAFTQGSVSPSLPFTFKTLKIVNLPMRPSVHILLDSPRAPHTKTSVRLVAPRNVYPLLHNPGEHKIFVPRNFVNHTPALYRGMPITGIDELKNILVNGLEGHKSNHGHKIFTAYEPLTPVVYAQPTHRFSTTANLPVLLKIPLTPQLEQYAPEHFATALAFHKSLPAGAISDVWVLLEVNKKADWYKAVLENGEIILFPAHAQWQDIP